MPRESYNSRFYFSGLSCICQQAFCPEIFQFFVTTNKRKAKKQIKLAKITYPGKGCINYYHTTICFYFNSFDRKTEVSIS